MSGIRSLHDLSSLIHQLSGLLSVAQEFSAEDSYQWFQEEARAIREKIETQRFHLGILGEFKAGKSTLLNALTETNFIPTGILPLTSIVTAVSYAPGDSAKVFFKNSPTVQIPITAIAQYVTEVENPGNRKQVERVEVFLPAPLLQDGLVILDTPGVGSFYEHNTEMTYAWLSRLDAAIFLLSADRPVSISELQFLEEVLRYVPRVFLALNKTDRLDPASLQEISKFNQEAIQRRLGQQMSIRPLSASLALRALEMHDHESMAASGVPALLNELQTFLIDNKGSVFVSSSIRQVERIFERLFTTLEAEKNFAQMPITELKERSERMQRIQKQAEQRESEVLVLLQHQEKELLRWLNGEVESFRQKTSIELIQEFHSFSAELSELKKMLFQWFRPALEKRTFDYLQDLERRTAAGLKTVLLPYCDSFQKIALELVGNLRQVIDLPLEFRIPEPVLDPRRVFWLNVKDPLEHVSLSAYSLFAYLSKSLTKKRLAKAYEESIRHQTEGAAGKIRNEISERIRSSFRKFYSAFHQSATDAMEAISMGLRRASEIRSLETREYQERIVRLDQRIASVQKTRSALKGLSIDNSANENKSQ